MLVSAPVAAKVGAAAVAAPVKVMPLTSMAAKSWVIVNTATPEDEAEKMSVFSVWLIIRADLPPVADPARTSLAEDVAVLPNNVSTVKLPGARVPSAELYCQKLAVAAAESQLSQVGAAPPVEVRQRRPAPPWAVKAIVPKASVE